MPSLRLPTLLLALPFPHAVEQVSFKKTFAILRAFLLFSLCLLMHMFFFLPGDKYNSQYTATQDLYGYHHEDESAFQAVETAKTQRQLFRGRKWQQVNYSFTPHTSTQAHTQARGELRCSILLLLCSDTPSHFVATIGRCILEHSVLLCFKCRANFIVPHHGLPHT